MKPIEFFKLQAKNLFRDFNTKILLPPEADVLYEYSPKHFDIAWVVVDFDINEEEFKLMNAQHIISQMVGFEKWTDLIRASATELELAKLLFDNMHKISAEEWKFYIRDVEDKNDIELDSQDKLSIFKTVFADVDGHQSDGNDYRLVKGDSPPNENQPIKIKGKISALQISALPLAQVDLKEFIETANQKFEELLLMMEPRHPGIIRKLWYPEKYIDKVLTPGVLPIDRDYAISLVEAFLVHHFIELDAEANKVG